MLGILTGCPAWLVSPTDEVFVLVVTNINPQITCVRSSQGYEWNPGILSPFICMFAMKSHAKTQRYSYHLMSIMISSLSNENEILSTKYD